MQGHTLYECIHKLRPGRRLGEPVISGFRAVVGLGDTFREEGEELSSSVARGPRTEAALTVLRGDNVGALYPLDRQISVIGRSRDVAVPLPDSNLSRHHAQIHRGGAEFTIEDLGSTNGTFVDGERVEGKLVLQDGCRIFLGTHTVLHFRLHDAVELEAARQTYALTVRDALTGVFNRRHLEERLWSEAAFARRHNSALSLILFDIDHFKRINDEHGHTVGDAALRLLAKALGGLTRQEDVLARYGGEEFALVARGIDRDNTLALAERMRQAIEAQRLPIGRGRRSFTISIGIAHSEAGSPMEAQHMFEAADRALYAAKDAGRNTVSIAPNKE
jgi:two-component system cell cycle response regulator